MKKILISSIVLLWITFNFINYSYANNDEIKVFKQMAITTTQVEEDYWKAVNKALDNYFMDARYKKDIVKLNKLEERLEKSLIKYKEKSFLNFNDRKKYNLLQNIYYRSKYITIYYNK